MWLKKCGNYALPYFFKICRYATAFTITLNDISMEEWNGIWKIILVWNGKFLVWNGRNFAAWNKEKSSSIP